MNRKHLLELFAWTSPLALIMAGAGLGAQRTPTPQVIVPQI